MNDLPANGEVWWADLADVGRRPVVVLSRNPSIPRTRRVTIAPCTTNVRGLGSEVALEPESDPVPRYSAVNLDAVHTVAVDALTHRLGRLSDDRMSEVCVAVARAFACSRSTFSRI